MTIPSPPVARVQVWSDPQGIWCYITHAAMAAYGSDCRDLSAPFPGQVET